MPEYSHNVQRLEELITGNSPGAVKYEGGAIGYYCYSAPEAVVQRTFIPAKANVPTHYHQASAESFIILSGQATLIIDDVSLPMRPGDTASIRPGQAHSWTVETDTLMICALVPRNGGYPSL
jgi:quercetin dioxygenase-like cupin family protein